MDRVLSLSAISVHTHSATSCLYSERFERNQAHIPHHKNDHKSIPNVRIYRTMQVIRFKKCLQNIVQRISIKNLTFSKRNLLNYIIMRLLCFQDILHCIKYAHTQLRFNVIFRAQEDKILTTSELSGGQIRSRSRFMTR